MPKTLDNIVKNPSFITTVKEVDETLVKLDNHTRETRETAVVLKIQNRGIGAVCIITSELEAIKECGKPFTGDAAEKGIKFYTRTYYELLRAGLVYGQKYRN